MNEKFDKLTKVDAIEKDVTSLKVWRAEIQQDVENFKKARAAKQVSESGRTAKLDEVEEEQHWQDPVM